jgi:Domain of unknown function (DUF4397)
MPGKSIRTAISLGVFSLVAALGLSPAVAAPVTATTSGQAMLRGGHFSPNTPGVDVYLTGFGGSSATLWLANVGYGDVSGYESIKPGVYAVSMRLHGASANSPAALSWTLNAQAGHAYTAAAVGMNSQLKGIVLDDELTPPPSGHGLVRVIQAASRAPEINIVAKDGPIVAHSTAFATTTGYTSVASGTWPLQASSVTAPTVSTSASVSIGSATVSSIVVLDGKQGGITLKTVLDAAGSATIPTGSVNAGGGGTAPAPGLSSGTDWLPDTLTVAALLLAAAAALVLLRLRSPRRVG